ncbi:MAG: hypothetical protein IKS12_03270, partial [Eubacterium sp.]|nr:hypothetical protein [Eubacterium sp.]
FLITAYIYLIVKSAYDKVGIRQIAAFCAGFALSCVNYEIFRFFLNPMKRHFLYLTLGVTVEMYANIPVAAIVILDLLLLLFAVFGYVKLKKNEKSRLTPSSLQEGMDSLRDGVVYSASDGIPLLVNKTMQRISMLAFGTAVFDVLNLENKYRSGNFINGCNLIKMGDIELLHLSDGTVWRFIKNEITIKKQTVSEIIAYDVTDLYNKSLELENRNAYFDKINKSLKSYSRNMDTIVRENEILSAKIKLHDDIGNALLMLRAYLNGNGEKRNELLEIWSFTVAVLRREAEAPNEFDELEILVNAAEAIGVELNISNEIPADIKENNVFTTAVHECITNTVKHANGSVINITVSNRTVEFTNDGTPPTGEIQETGGLRNLRRKAEENGIVMLTKASPQFLLSLTFPDGK